MKLESLRIQNFRAIDDETIHFDDYTCLIGANGCGKSTVLCALNIFFRETSGSSLNLINLEKEDFHNGDTTKPIYITATFTDLTEDAKTDFADYYRQNKLIITTSAEFDPETGTAVTFQHGQRTGMNDFKKFFEEKDDGAKSADLKEIYNEYKQKYQDLPAASSIPNMSNALRTYEESHAELCDLIISEDQFYGFSKGANRLANYIQWVFVPAVKDASNEQTEAKDSALGKLLARTVRAKINFQDPLKKLKDETKTKYEELIYGYQSELDQHTATLQAKIIEWANPNVNIKLEWQQDPNKTVKLDEPFAQIIAGEGPFTGNIARLGHGLQRSYLMALLQELSMSKVETAPTLLLGCEEPELYQHPPQIKHLANLLQNLSEQNSQIIITTHSPYFISGTTFENVRLVRKDISTSKAQFYQITFDEIDDLIRQVEGDKIARPMGVLAKIHQSLQPSLNEMFYSPKLVFVEGLEDIAYITTYLNLMNMYDETRRLGIHIVPTHNKSNMILPLCIAKKFNIPTYIVFDSDSHLEDKNGSKSKHKKNNTTLLKLVGIKDPVPFPDDNFWGGNVTMWKSEIGKEIKSDFDPRDWERYSDQIRNKYAKEKDLNKNYLYIADTLEMAWNDDKKSENLQKLCIEILEFAKQ
ncbi:MAG: ATP-dependent endonuclease [Candidatus Dadabacteria bacterium]